MPGSKIWHHTKCQNFKAWAHNSRPVGKTISCLLYAVLICAKNWIHWTILAILFLYFKNLGKDPSHPGWGCGLCSPWDTYEHTVHHGRWTELKKKVRKRTKTKRLLIRPGWCEMRGCEETAQKTKTDAAEERWLRHGSRHMKGLQEATSFHPPLP